MTLISICRVSSREQKEGYSLDAQDRANREWSRRNGHTILETILYQETASKRAKRERWRTILDRIRDDPRVDGAVFHKIDRASRNMPDWYQIEQLQDEFGKSFFFATQNFATDATGRLNARVMASFAAFYTENLAEEVKKGFAEAIRRGHFPHRPPYGYRHYRSNGHTSEIVVDETRASTVRLIYELYASRQHSLSSLREHLFREGIYYTEKTPRFVRSHLEKLLKNRFYLGKIPWRGGLHPGRHPAIITPALFDRVQAVFAGHNRHHYGRWDVYYSGGLITCGQCEAAVTVEVVKGRYAYARCSRIGHAGHPRIRLPGRRIEGHLLEIVRAISLPTDVCEWLGDLNAQREVGRVAWQVEQERRLLTRTERLRTRLDALYIDKLHEEISVERYRDLERTWHAEVGEVERAISRCRERRDAELVRRQSMIERLRDPVVSYVHMRPAARRRILDALCLEIRLVGDRLVPTYHAPFDLLVRACSYGPGIGRDDPVAVAGRRE